MTRPRPINRCAAYIRVSSSGQVEKYSPEFQLTQIVARIARAGGVLVKTYQDLGISGAYLDERTDLNEAISDIKAGEIDTLCFYDVERYSRDIEHQQRIKKAILKAGGNLLFCTIEYSPTADGEIAFNVSGLLAERQRKKIRELSIGGRETAARKGIQPQRANNPYGYHIVNNHDVIRGTYGKEQLGKYVFDPATIDNARLIFQLVEDGLTLRRIQAEMIKRGIPAPKGGRLWHTSTIKKIISNPCYKGRPAYGRRSNHYDSDRTARGVSQYHTVSNPESEWIVMECEPAVSVETWERCNRILSDNKLRWSGYPKSRRLLSGLIDCPGCGRKMVGVRNETRQIYVCQRNARYHDKSCASHYRNAKRIESSVIAAVLDVVAHPREIQAAYKEYVEKQSRSVDRGEIHRIKRELAALAKKEKLTAEARIEDRLKGIRNTVIYDEILAEAAERRGKLEAELAVISSTQTAISGPAPDFTAWAESVRDDAEAVLTSPMFPDCEKNRMLGTLIDRIETPAKRSVVVWFKATNDNSSTIVWRDGVLEVAI